MGSQNSLMATVSSIMNWVVQYENMGLLNVFFKPTNDGQFEENINTNDIIDYFKNVVLQRPLSLPVLGALPSDLEGGSEGVKMANAHPNREPTILWVTVALFLLFLLFIVILWIVNCCCRPKKPERALRRLQVGTVNADLEHKSTVCRITYLVFMTMSVLFLVGSVVLLAIYFASADLVVSFVGSSDNSDSLSSGLSSSSKNIAEFFEEGIEGGKEKTNAAVKNLVDQANTKVGKGLSENIDSLLKYLQIPQTLQYGKSSLNELETAQNTAAATLTNLETLKEAFEKYERKIVDLKNEYEGLLGSQPQPDPGRPDINKLKSPIKSSNLELSGLEAYKFALDGVVPKLSDQLEEVQATLDKIEEKKTTLPEEIQNALNLNDILSITADFWKDIKTKVDPLIDQMNGFMDTLLPNISSATTVLRVVLYGIGGLLIFMLIIAVLITIRLLHRNLRDHLYEDPHLLSVNPVISTCDKCACGKCSACCCSILFVIILTVFTVIIGLMLFVLTMASGEGCIYFMKDTAVEKTDYVLNSVLAEQFDKIVSGDSSDFVNFQQPKNLLTAIVKKCDYNSDETTVGLLSAVGYTNLVNVEKLRDNEKLKSGIETGKDKMKTQIEDMDIGDSLPDPSQIKKAMDDATALDFSSLVSETADYDQKIQELEELYQSCTNYEVHHPELAGTNQKFRTLLDKIKGQSETVNGAHSDLSDLSDKSAVKTSVTKFVDSAQHALDRAKDKTGLIEEVEKNYDSFTEQFLDFVEAQGSEVFSKLTQELLPCLPIHKAYTSGIGVACGESGGIHRLIGYFYILALNLLFLALLYFALFNFSFFQFIIIRMSTATKHEFYDDNTKNDNFETTGDIDDEEEEEEV